MTALLLASAAFGAKLVDSAGAQALLDRGATLLDTRSTMSFLAGHLPGAASVSWRIGVVGGSRSGTLGPPDAVAAAFAALGVSNGVPVLVVGDWTSGWGEEGRIAWDLEYLGHDDVSVLQGGARAWTGAWSYGPTWPARGQFQATPRPALRVDREALKASGALRVDVREPDEFAGSNGYFAAYGGHVPDAVNRPWRSLVDGSAEPLPKDQPLIVYCTGGVRSAFAWLWLTNQGYTVSNYDGSWWDWSAHEPAP